MGFFDFWRESPRTAAFGKAASRHTKRMAEENHFAKKVGIKVPKRNPKRASMLTPVLSKRKGR